MGRRDKPGTRGEFAAKNAIRRDFPVIIDRKGAPNGVLGNDSKEPL